MERHYYKCTFLSDIILNESSATEGHSKTLDYISGSNFLGIIAIEYESFANQAYKIFHSGNVHFGDAHLMINGKRSLKKPVSWLYEKMDINYRTIYVHHLIDDAMRKDFYKKSKQLKTITPGFFITEDTNIFSEKINHTYSMKSAHDFDNRKSKEGAMFGYDALNKGSEWIFFIDGNEKNINSIEKYLIGEKRIGRSKSAQYGSVNIQKLSSYQNFVTSEKKALDYNGNKILLVYFDSCAIFFDKYHQPTYIPSEKNLLLEEGLKINWKLSQIKTRNYATWNSQRKTRDYDRVCIDKGSVIAVNINDNFNFEAYCKKVQFGMGLFKNEGLGQVIINPSFLIKTKKNAVLDYKMIHKNEQASLQQVKSFVPQGENDQLIISQLEAIALENRNQAKVLEAINTFLNEKATKKMNNIKSSQWGQIRSLAMRSNSKDELIDLLFNEDEKNIENQGFLVHGKAYDNWRPHKDFFKDTIKNLNIDDDDDYVIQFVINVSSEMAKRKSMRGEQ